VITLPRRREDRGASNGMFGLAAVVGVIAAFLGVFTFANATDTTDAGQVAVVRNGGLANNDVRAILQPASGLSWTGYFSSSRKYPAQQRYYTISATGAADKHTIEQVPTADGVEVGVSGTVYFQLNLDPKALAEFDSRYGTRTYPAPDGSGDYVSIDDPDRGWQAFLDAVFQPVISNDLRQQIGTVHCAELQASCALIASGQNYQAVAAAAGQGNLSIAKVQTAINASLEDDLTATLGGRFFTGVRFNLSGITLPDQVQTSINNAQAAFAGVAQAEAKVQQAKAEADANAAREKGYLACPACAQIDTLKAIPPNVTTFAPGAGFAVTAK